MVNHQVKPIASVGAEMSRMARHIEAACECRREGNSELVLTHLKRAGEILFSSKDLLAEPLSRERMVAGLVPSSDVIHIAGTQNIGSSFNMPRSGFPLGDFLQAGPQQITRAYVVTGRAEHYCFVCTDREQGRTFLLDAQTGRCQEVRRESVEDKRICIRNGVELHMLPPSPEKKIVIAEIHHAVSADMARLFDARRLRSLASTSIADDFNNRFRSASGGWELAADTRFGMLRMLESGSGASARYKYRTSTLP